MAQTLKKLKIESIDQISALETQQKITKYIQSKLSELSPISTDILNTTIVTF